MAPESAPKPELANDYPAQIYSGDHHPPEYVAYLDRAASAMKSLKMIVFGVLSVSLVIAAYGFFLIYQLTRDSHRMVEQTVRMADEMVAMRASMATIGDNVDAMRGAIVVMGGDIRTMNQSVTGMNQSVGHLASSVGLIQHSTANLDRSFGPAMGMLNNFVPFGWGGNSWRGAPPYAPPPQQGWSQAPAAR